MSKKLPAGKYYLGDPCYVIEGEKWDEFLGPYWDVGGHGGIFDFDGLPVCAFQTQWGDGCYEASTGARLGVDAGIIGVVPAALMTTGDFSLGDEVEFDEPFECSRDSNGMLHFGRVSVMTGDEEEFCDCCGEYHD